MSVTHPPNDPGSPEERTADEEAAHRSLPRRRFISLLSSMGLTGGLFPGVLWAKAQDAGEITTEVVAAAEKLVGVTFSPEERAMMVERLTANRESFDELRALAIPDDVSPVFQFDSDPNGRGAPEGPSFLRPSEPASLPDPTRPVDLAFASIAQLRALLSDGTVSSVELTRLYLDRLRRFDEDLACVVTLTEALAIEQAERADREIAQGRIRGPLHGIPWGAKDLLSTRGYPTSWGATPYRGQRFEREATVVRRLEEAGAVLVAKLTLGALARGDRWFGGQTKNPWNLEEGSSGSSAGSAAATSAGLVGFAIGSETVGSIVSPSARCGATGLRPSFGRVSRFGAMTLSWTMDKVGPIGRSAEDCATVLSVIQGPDGLDRSVRDVPFGWDGDRGVSALRVGYLAEAFEGSSESRETDVAALRTLSDMGVSLRPVGFPDGLPIDAMRLTVSAESAASFDTLTRSDRDDLLRGQDEDDWPNTFRTARLIPAVEYIQANRARAMLIEALDEAWADVDVVVAPTFADGLVLATNLSGHPVVAVPAGFRANGTPTSISFVGAMWRDAEALLLAKAFQTSTEYHLRRPPRFS